MKKISILLISVMLLALNAFATTFTVSNTSLIGAGSLQQAILNANGDNTATATNPHIINITLSGTLSLSSGPALTSLNNHITINAPSAGFTIVGRATVRPLGAGMTGFVGYTIVLNNLNLTGGSGANLGMGFLSNGCLVTMNNCNVYDNSAVQRGGGIYSRNLGGVVPQLTLNNCQIYNNASTSAATTPASNGGGGIYADGPLTLTNCTVYGNTSAGVTTGGAGIYTTFPLTVTNSTFYNNVATGGGGGAIYAGSAFTMSGCTLYSNSCTLIGGGAIYLVGAQPASISYTTLRNNSTTTAAANHGGAIFYNGSGGFSLSFSTVNDNSTTGASSGGGGIRFNGAGSGTISNCTFFNNSATGSGGGVSSNSTATVTINNATFTRNSSTNGGGVFFSAGLVKLNYSIAVGNTSSGTGPDLSGTGFDSDHNYNRIGSSSGFTWASANASNTTGETMPGLFGTATPSLAANGATGVLTQSVALAAGANNAVLTNAGVIAGLTGMPAKDQRNFLRNNAASRSIGAIERDAQSLYLASIESAPLSYFVPGSNATALTTTLEASADGNVVSATLDISSGYVAGKELLIANNLPAGMTATWNGALGRLTLAGSLIPQLYQNALRQVTYQHTDLANPSYGARTVSVLINNGSVNSNTQSRTINVSLPPVPTVSNTEAAALDYLIGCNGATAFNITQTTTVGGVGINSVTVQITGNYQNGQDLLELTSPPAGISAAWNAALGTLTLTGAVATSVYQTALRAVTYKNTSAAPNVSVRTLTMTAGNGIDAPNPPLDSRTRNINLLTISSVVHPGQNIEYPADVVVNILCYRADLNNGIVDATPYINQAIIDHAPPDGLYRKVRKILYFPNGTYRLSNSIAFDNLENTLTIGNGKGIIFQGQSRDHTILKLTDNNPNFQNAANPRPVLSNSRTDFLTNAFSNVAFMNSIQNLTVDIGSGNPGAAGIRFIVSNEGSLRDVLIKSSDPAKVGWAGIDMERSKIPGPGFIKNVEVDGFDYGVRISSPNYSMTFEYLTLRNSRVGGIRNNENCLNIRKLTTSNITGAAIENLHANGMVTLLDSDLGGMAGATAIVNNGFLFARMVNVAGFSNSINDRGTLVSGNISEYVYGTPLKKWADAPNTTLNIDGGNIPDTPEMPWDAPSTWVDVCSFHPGGYVPGSSAVNPVDIGPAIQAAIAFMNQPGNESRKTLYFKSGIYTLSSPVTISGNVRRIVGAFSTFYTTVASDASTSPMFTINTTNTPLVIEQLNIPPPLSWLNGTDRRRKNSLFLNNSSNDVVLRNIFLWGGKGYQKGTATGRLFIEDVATLSHHFFMPNATYIHPFPEAVPQLDFGNQTVYARQLNTEQEGTKVETNGGKVWILGLKTEQSGAVVRAINNAQAEVMGGFILGGEIVPDPVPIAEVINSTANFIFGEQMSSSAFALGRFHNVLVSETRDCETRTLNRGETPQRLLNYGTPASVVNLYIAKYIPTVLSATLVASGTLTCAQTSVTLSASATGGTSYTLSNGQSNSTGVFAVSTAGTYTVTVSNASGCTATATAIVTSNTTAPTASLAASGTLTCATPSVTLTTTATGGTSYTLSDGQSNSTGVFVVSTAGTYTVTVSNASGCTATATAIVTSNTTAPTASLATSGTLTCANTSVTLTTTATSATSYTLSNGQSNTTGVFVVSTAGTYTVTVSNASGCNATATAIVTSNTTAPTASLAASGSITCAQTSVTLTTTATGGTSYSLSNGQSNTTGVFVVSTAGTYTVTVSNASGCTATAMATVSSSNTAVLNASGPAASSVVCEGSTVVVPVTVTGTPTGFQWYRNGPSGVPGAVTGQNTATLTLGNVQPIQAGSYSLVVMGTCNALTTSAFVLTVNPAPTVTLTFPSGSTVVGPETIVATITVPAPLTGVVFQAFGGVLYERVSILDRINGYEIRQVDTNGTGIFPITRPGSLRLTVTGANGCKRTVEGVIVVQ